MKHAFFSLPVFGSYSSVQPIKLLMLTAMAMMWSFVAIAQGSGSGAYVVNGAPPDTGVPDSIAFGDSISPSQAAQTIFQSLPLSQVPSGILLDYSMSPHDYSPLVGLPANKIEILPYTVLEPVTVIGGPENLALTKESVMALPGWYGLNQMLHDATVQANAWPAPSNETLANEVITLEDNTDAVPLGLILADYDRLVPNAINDGIAYWSGNSLQSSATPSQLFESQTMVAIAPLSWAGSETNISLVLSQNMVYHNGTNGLQQIEVQINDVYQPITLGQPFTVPTLPEGETLTFRITRADGQYYYARTLLSYIEPAVQANDWTIPADLVLPNFSATEEFPGIQGLGTAKISITYGCGNDRLIKPMILVEGFNPPEYALTNGLLSYEERIIPRNIMGLDDAGFDIVYIDFNDGGDFIQRNAMVVQAVIRMVNAEKAENGSTYQNVVVGSSMGGLVARFALADMEQDGEDHETELFVSLDSPHRGANVPVAFQHMALHGENLRTFGAIRVQWFIDLINDRRARKNKGPIPGPGFGVDIMNNPAARQMLMIQADEGQQTHDQFMTELEQLGMPTQCRNIALSNGNRFGQTTVNGALPGDRLFGIYGGQGLAFLGGLVAVYGGLVDQDATPDEEGFWESTMGNISAGVLAFTAGVLAESLTPLVIYAECWTLDNQRPGKPVYAGFAIGSVLGIPITLLPAIRVEDATRPNVDLAAGGFYTYDEDIPLIAFGAGRFNYIPTASALNIDPADFATQGVGDDMFTMDLSQNLGLVTAFDAFRTADGLWADPTLGNVNEPHVALWNDGFSFVMDEIEGHSLPLNLQILDDPADFMNITENTTPFLGIATLSNGSRLLINGNEQSGLSTSVIDELFEGPVNGSHVDVFTDFAINCNGNASNVNVLNGGEVFIGANEVDQNGNPFSTTANLFLQNGAAFTLNTGATLEIHPGSALIIECGATLTIQGTPTIIVHPGAMIINEGTINGTLGHPTTTVSQTGPITGDVVGYQGENLQFSTPALPGLIEYDWVWKDGSGNELFSYTTTTNVLNSLVPGITENCTNNVCQGENLTLEVTPKSSVPGTLCMAFNTESHTIKVFPTVSYSVSSTSVDEFVPVTANIINLPADVTAVTWETESAGPDPTFTVSANQSSATVNTGRSDFYVEATFVIDGRTFEFSQLVYVNSVDFMAALDETDELVKALKAKTQVVPNPSLGRFQVILPAEAADGQYQYTVSHPAGSVVWQQQGGNRQNIDLSGLKAGLYYLTIIGEDVRVVKPIILQ